MRNLPSYISQRLNQNIQSRSNKTDINSKIWVSRPSTVLLDERLLERQTVTNATITDVSIAVCHPRAQRMNTDIYVAYISNGTARVATAKHKMKMDAHIWVDTGFSQNATALSIAFDGTMPRSIGNEVEFVTDYDPWIFWINDTVLYGQQLSSAENPTVLVESKCTDVSAVRAMWSSVGGFDFGLVVFFILDGKLHYKQLINGEWMDAEVVSYGPDGATWKEVSTFRTWDYRIGVQLKSIDDRIYELYTQFMGVGKQLAEHLQVDIKPKAITTPIKYSTFKQDEHIETGINPIAKRIYGLSSVPISATNVDDGTGNYGLIVHVTLDYPVTNVYGNNDSFVLKDGNGNSYSCTDARVSDDGLTLLLTFVDFNLAFGTDVTVEYTPGTILSPATTMNAFSFTFTPEGLVSPSIDKPEVVAMWNIGSDGTKIAIEFTEPIIGDLSNNENKFTVATQEYNYVPGGSLSKTTKDVAKVLGDYASLDKDLELVGAVCVGTECVGGQISLAKQI